MFHRRGTRPRRSSAGRCTTQCRPRKLCSARGRSCGRDRVQSSTAGDTRTGNQSVAEKPKRRMAVARAAVAAATEARRAAQRQTRPHGDTAEGRAWRRLRRPSATGVATRPAARASEHEHEQHGTAEDPGEGKLKKAQKGAEGLQKAAAEGRKKERQKERQQRRERGAREGTGSCGGPWAPAVHASRVVFYCDDDSFVSALNMKFLAMMTTIQQMPSLQPA